MFEPTAMIMADKATRRHVLSARPTRRTTPERPPRQRGDAIARLTVRRCAVSPTGSSHAA